jgi:hypothetical protein
MKIVDETRREGRHAVRFIAESEIDKHILTADFFRAFHEHPVLRAKIEHVAGDDFPSLYLEELPAQ